MVIDTAAHPGAPRRGRRPRAPAGDPGPASRGGARARRSDRGLGRPAARRDRPATSRRSAPRPWPTRIQPGAGAGRPARGRGRARRRPGRASPCAGSAATARLVTGSDRDDGGGELDQSHAPGVPTTPDVGGSRSAAPAATTTGRPAWALFLGLAAAVLVVDQLTKAWVVAVDRPGLGGPTSSATCSG